MKKLLAILCAVMLLVACCIPVLADEPETGSITITNTVEGQDYSIYMLATVEYNATQTAYEYVALDDWADFFKTKAAEYFEYNETTGVVKAKDGASEKGAEIAALAIEYATDGMLTATTQEAEGDSVVFEGLELGYYLIDSSVGTLCILDTTNPDFEKAEKNPEPTIDKTVDKAAAEIGDEVNFTITITKEAGAINYVVHDTMTEGLEFSGTVTISTEVDDVTTPFDEYDLNNEPDDGCTFEVEFHNEALEELKDGTVITITYSATLTEDAFIVGEGTNKNEAELNYGENSDLSTTKPVVTVSTYKFDLVKTDADKKLLADAIFELYDSSDNLVGLTKLDEHTYIVDPEGKDKITTVADNYITIKGLAADKYSLKEVEAPAGYNKLTTKVPVDLEGGANISTSMEGTTWKDTDGGIQITNKTGTVLPETGGFGTTMFILIGGGLMLCTGILLVTKKRMEKIAD